MPWRSTCQSARHQFPAQPVHVKQFVSISADSLSTPPPLPACVTLMSVIFELDTCSSISAPNNDGERHTSNIPLYFSPLHPHTSLLHSTVPATTSSSSSSVVGRSTVSTATRCDRRTGTCSISRRAASCFAVTTTRLVPAELTMFDNTTLRARAAASGPVLPLPVGVLPEAAAAPASTDQVPECPVLPKVTLRMGRDVVDCRDEGAGQV